MIFKTIFAEQCGEKDWLCLPKLYTACLCKNSSIALEFQRETFVVFTTLGQTFDRLIENIIFSA
jgi:hypothetical protein